jgi:FKBP-type peptidyl-prolyl cis-trans isomerase FkpA
MSLSRCTAALSIATSALLASGAALAQAPAAKPAADFLATAAAAKGAVLSESGLVYLSLKDGQGESPAAIDTVRVHYRGTLTDGKEFDSSYSRGQPISFPLNRVIRCWTEGVQKMKVGGKARLTCPASIAYGERGTPGGPIPPNAVLQFEVELLGIIKP